MVEVDSCLIPKMGSCILGDDMVLGNSFADGTYQMLVKRYNELEFIQCACRFTENCTMCDNGGGGSKRQETKILLRRLKRDNPNIENSIFRSIHAVALDTMPGYKSEGVEHSFLERFHAQEEAFNKE